VEQEDLVVVVLAASVLEPDYLLLPELITPLPLVLVALELIQVQPLQRQEATAYFQL
jgi:hypothetical protein